MPAPERRVVAAGAAAADGLGCGGARRGRGSTACAGWTRAGWWATLTERLSGIGYGNARLPWNAPEFHRMPVVQGSTPDEMRLFVPVTPASRPVDGGREYGGREYGGREYGERLRTLFGASAPGVAAACPEAAFPAAAIACATAPSDASFACPALRDSRALTGTRRCTATCSAAPARRTPAACRSARTSSFGRRTASNCRICSRWCP
ncbi:hypothetical protein [Streptomyces sp. NPDC001389]|uniref:hypothetical protein n=1 Tax=Streptomyces sp. NPDC001389 TaxID=3364569 RepID=UPI003678549D